MITESVKYNVNYFDARHESLTKHIHTHTANSITAAPAVNTHTHQHLTSSYAAESPNSSVNTKQMQAIESYMDFHRESLQQLLRLCLWQMGARAPK
ncbi:unnamed protein product [Ceratitis capitata]|uniref:(Mediterranean fruit fly) hypothetical protein n=1 Tax=Ceratitis capitata TaxID=7213 RepID=A0A811UGL9_CERCA|nr:unnamed protein product [Ceratitis capitata]